MIKVYTTPTCAYCHALMDWLDNMGFDRPAIKRALRRLEK